VPLLLACDFCFQRGFECVMAENLSSKCSVCQKRGHKCVTTSWESLDRTRSEKAAAISKDLILLEEVQRRHQQEMLELTARLNRNRKVLELADARARARALQTSKQLEEEEAEEERRKQAAEATGDALPAASAAELPVDWASTGWELMGWEGLAVPDEIVEANASNSQGG